jgi:hypothetical protein
MAKKSPTHKTPPEQIDIIVESDQWESATPPRFTWKHGLIIALILAGAILFAFGFLVVAGIVLVAAIVVNLIAFIIRKLT